MENLKQKTLKGVIYKFLERVGAAGIQLFVSIILARILAPSEYGMIAIVLVVIALLDVFVTYGFGNSLVIDNNSDQVDFSTCFYFGLALSIVLYIALYFSAPSISHWFSYDKQNMLYKYDVDLLTNVFRVMSLRLPIAAINSVQHAFVQKNMLFRKFFYSTLIGTIVSGAVAVLLAFMDFGVWALVGQYLGNVIIDTLCLFIIVKWYPTKSFSLKKLKKIYSYGWKILVVGLIDVGYCQLRSVVIAKKYTSADLAYYNKGNEFPSTINNFIEPTISSVSLPALSKVKDEKDTMKSITRRFIKTSTFLLFPAMIGLACVAYPLIKILLTDKWIDSVLFLQILCLAYLLRPVQFINNSVIRASGRSDLLLILDLIKKGIGIILLIIGAYYGVVGIAVSFAVTNVVSTFINIWPNKKILGCGYLEQLKDIMGNLLLAILMGVAVYSVSFLNINIYLQLFLQILTGIIVYVALSIVTNNDSFKYLSNLLIQKMHINTNNF